jgi:hypothetical protein
LGEAIHGTYPNEVIHYDFCKIWSQDVLLIRDDFSGKVQLRHSKSASSDEVVKYLFEWISSNGIPRVQVSDQGSHFKNKVISTLNERLRSKHHFTVAYTPWANGSIEIIVKDFETTLKKLRLEMKVPKSDWTSLIPLVEYAMNHAPRSEKCGYSPIEIFSGMKPSHPLDALLTPLTKEFNYKPITAEAIENHVQSLIRSMDEVHRKVNDSMKSNRQRKRSAANSSAKEVNFGLGDFVMVAIPKGKIRNKFQVAWNGPMQITEEISDWVFKVETLDGAKSEIVHASRLKFYSETLDNIAEEVISDSLSISKQEYFQIDSLLDIRKVRKGYEVLVQWLGFSDEDNSWEPIESLYDDVPLLLHDFLLEKEMDFLWKTLRQGSE